MASVAPPLAAILLFMFPVLVLKLQQGYSLAFWFLVCFILLCVYYWKFEHLVSNAQGKPIQASLIDQGVAISNRIRGKVDGAEHTMKQVALAMRAPANGKESVSRADEEDFMALHNSIQAAAAYEDRADDRTGSLAHAADLMKSQGIQSIEAAAIARSHVEATGSRNTHPVHKPTTITDPSFVQHTAATSDKVLEMGAQNYEVMESIGVRSVPATSKARAKANALEPGIIDGQNAEGIIDQAVTGGAMAPMEDELSKQFMSANHMGVEGDPEMAKNALAAAQAAAKAG
jgi:hypothetical protein